MADKSNAQKRTSVLANVAEKYYIEGKDQSTIALEVGVTRSMVSRMLTEARNLGIVEIRINRPIHSDRELEEAIYDKFRIKSVFVVSMDGTGREKILEVLGSAAAGVLKQYLTSDPVVGVTWGTTISAAVDAVQPQPGLSTRIVQLVGAQGAKNVEYDGHALVKRLAEKLGGEGYYLNAPCLCQSAEIAESIRETRGIRETIELGKQIGIALLGIGTTETEYSSFYLSGLLTAEELEPFRKNKVVGDIAGNYFKQDGSPYMDDFLRRMITIHWEDLQKVPVRIGVAGGPGKTEAIIGALRSGLITHLVIDSITARLITQKAD
jgi:deoxyribonucleoside regulator